MQANEIYKATNSLEKNMFEERLCEMVPWSTASSYKIMFSCGFIEMN
jgi:hypothetical protein